MRGAGGRSCRRNQRQAVHRLRFGVPGCAVVPRGTLPGCCTRGTLFLPCAVVSWLHLWYHSGYGTSHFHCSLFLLPAFRLGSALLLPGWSHLRSLRRLALAGSHGARLARSPFSRWRRVACCIAGCCPARATGVVLIWGFLLLAAVLFVRQSWLLAEPRLVRGDGNRRPAVALLVAAGRFGSGVRVVRVPLPWVCGCSVRVMLWMAVARVKGKARLW